MRLQMVKKEGLMFQSAAKHEGTSASFFDHVWIYSNVCYFKLHCFSWKMLFFPKRHFLKIVTKKETSDYKEKNSD